MAAWPHHFASEVLPIHCHSQKKRKRGRDLDNSAIAVSRTQEGVPIA